jgi:hypothetical protein
MGEPGVAATVGVPADGDGDAAGVGLAATVGVRAGVDEATGGGVLLGAGAGVGLLSPPPHAAANNIAAAIAMAIAIVARCRIDRLRLIASPAGSMTRGGRSTGHAAMRADLRHAFATRPPDAERVR